LDFASVCFLGVFALADFDLLLEGFALFFCTTRFSATLFSAACAASRDGSPNPNIKKANTTNNLIPI